MLKLRLTHAHSNFFLTVKRKSVYKYLINSETLITEKEFWFQSDKHEGNKILKVNFREYIWNTKEIG